jgi:type IV pilus assembly protein PilW
MPFNNWRIRAFSLIELMVAMAVGVVVIGVVTALYSSMASSSAALTNASQQLQNGSYAIEFLSQELRHAGYYGGLYSAPANSAVALPDPCVSADVAALSAALVFPVQGYDAPAAAPVSCLQPADFVPGTDVLVLRRVSTQLTPVVSLTPQQVYLQNNNDWTDANNPAVNVGVAANFTLLNKDGVTPADIRQYQVRIYYVSPCHQYAAGATACSAGADGGRPVPTLRMLELTAGAGGALMSSVALAEGVENLQIDYGIDSSGQGAAQGFVTSPATLADWGNVTEIKLNLLVRNPVATPGYMDLKTYRLGLAAPVAPGGAFKRHVYTQHVRLTNVAEAREAP